MVLRIKRVSPITVNGRFFSQRITGVQRYAHEMLGALDQLRTLKQIEQIPITIFAPPDAQDLPRWSSFEIRIVGRVTGQLWEQVELPKHARGSLLFTPCGGAPVVHDRHIITIHDAGPFTTPRSYRAAYRTYYKAQQRHLARKAIHILTVSEFSRQELIHSLRISPARISYTHLSGQHVLRFERDESVLGRHELEVNRYLLTVGSRNPNKNLDGLIKAVSLLRSGEISLAIAGTSNQAIFGQTQRLGNSVKELGFVGDAELRSLYEHASCFVFPSFYEGFGLPPLEALTLGCKVLVSRAASLPEIFKGAAIYCDPSSPEDMARQITASLELDHPSRTERLERANELTWADCARRTWSHLIEGIKSQPAVG